MEKWTYKKYRNPYLDIDNIQTIGNKLFVKSTIDNFDIELLDEKIDSDEVKSILDNLRDPSHPSWNKIKEEENEIISNLLTTLDEQSLIINHDNISLFMENQIREIEAKIDKMVSLLEKKITSKHSLMNVHLPILINASAYQLKLLCDEIGIDLSFQYLAQNEQRCDDNFFIATILHQIKYLKKSHPLALLTWLVSLCKLNKLSLTRISGLEDFITLYWKEVALNWLSSTFNVDEITIYQACLASNLINSTTENARPIFKIDNLEEHFSIPMSGINFMIKIERLTSSILEKRDEFLFFKKISSNFDENNPLIRGIFIEQYHVTRRFVEIITPLLNKRFNNSLRKRAFNYYKEEYGHEKFELKTCNSLGISENDLMNACPLPLMQAYVDIFTNIADFDQIGFFISIMITEGIIGTSSPILHLLDNIMINNIAYQRVARKHDSLNIDLNHAYLSRLFMVDIKAVTPQSQQIAIKNFLYLLELNHRSLDQMTSYYSNQKNLTFYRGLESGIISC